jgi:head decoration protein D
MYRTGSSAKPVTSIIGKDLDAGATFNADVALAAGVLEAGTIVKYDTTAKTFAKWVGGTDAVGLIFGILAQGVDATSATVVEVGMCYRRGVFNRQEIESANNLLIAPGGATDVGLKDTGIYLDLTYDSYDNLTPVPAGAVLTPPYH